MKRQEQREKFNFSSMREIATKMKSVRIEIPCTVIFSRDRSRAMTRPIPIANQPTEDESGEARRKNLTKELQKAYLATSSGKEEEEAVALPVVPAACDRTHCRHNKGERFKQ